MKPRAHLTDQVLVRLTPDMRERLEAVAAREELPVSAAARRLIRQGLDNGASPESSPRPRRRSPT